jgi:hypothetical protein
MADFLHNNEYICMNRDGAKRIAKALAIKLDNAKDMFNGYCVEHNLGAGVFFRVWRKHGVNYYRIESAIHNGAQPQLNADIQQYAKLLGWGGFSAERF